MRREPNRLLLALIAIGLIVLGVAFVFTKRIPFVNGYRLSADFQSSNQLTPGFSPVRIAGVTVGKVTSIEDGPGDLSRVKMELKDTALPIREDARVRIRPRLFLEGGFYVELNPGSPSAPKIADNAVLPRAQTAGPVQLHQILTVFDQGTLGELRSIVKELDIALDNGGAEGFGRAIVAFGPVLRDTAQIAEAARGENVHDVSEGIAATSKVTAALARRESELRGLVTNLATTTSTLASRDTQLSRTIVELDGLIREAPDSLDRLDRVQPKLRRFIEELRPTLRISPPILRDTTKTLVQLRLATRPSELPRTLRLLSPIVRGLPSLQNRLNTLFPLVTPTLECLRDPVAPILNSTVPDRELTSGLAVWQELAQAGTGVVGFAQNFDGNGFWSRYLNGAGEQSFATGVVPGLGQLVGTTSEPISGSRPTYLGPGRLPPNRPDAPCADQGRPDLSQRTGGGTPASTARIAVKPTGTPRTAGRLRQRLQRAMEEAASR